MTKFSIEYWMNKILESCSPTNVSQIYTTLENKTFLIASCALLALTNPSNSETPALITWLTTSKYRPKVVEGLRLHTFHWLVPPTPISYTATQDNYTHCCYAPDQRQQGGGGCGSRLTFSDTQGPLEWRETQGPTVPQTFSSLDVCRGEDTSEKWGLLSETCRSFRRCSNPHFHFNDASEGHAEVTVVVFAEDPLKGLLEQGGVEGVAHHNVAPVDTTSQSPLQVERCVELVDDWTL